MSPHEVLLEPGPPQSGRPHRRAVSVDSVSPSLAAEDLLDLPARPTPAPAPQRAAASTPAGPGFVHPFAAEWLALLFGLALTATLIGWSLFRSHEAVDLTERDRLVVQARVVDDNIAQQLDGMNRALASVREEFVATPVHSVSILISARLKALSDAIPGVRSMVLLGDDGTVLASSVDTLLGRDFADREYFLSARTKRDPATLHVAPPYKTSLGNYTVVFTRAIVGANGAFAGVVAAALEPQYFEVLMRSVLYAPDMWVSLGHGDGKVFVTMPRAAERIDGDGLPSRDVLGPVRNDASGATLVVGTMGGSRVRMTALQYMAPHDLALDKPLVIAVSRVASSVFAAWRKQALEYSVFFLLLSAGAVFGLHRGQARRRAFAVLEAEAARERHRNAEQLGLALQGADLGLWDWDVRDDVFHQNEVIRAQLGYQPGELGPLGSNWRANVHPDDAERLISAIEAHFRGETAAYECEFRVRHKAGHWVWLLSRGKVVERDECDMPVRMTGTHMDLSRRKRNQAQMERSAEMLRRTGELANIGGWELDLATMRVDWSEQVFRIHEVQPGALLQIDSAPRLLCARGPAGPARGDRRRRPRRHAMGPRAPLRHRPRQSALGAGPGCRRVRGRQAGAPARRLPGHHREEDDRPRDAPAERAADAAIDDRCADRRRQPTPVRPDAEDGMAARRPTAATCSACS
jgi:PAS domain S-box-containing protein